MKHLRPIFESEEDEYATYGISPDDVKDMFIELQDEGWIVRVNFTKKLFQWQQSGLLNKDDVKFGLQPYIEIKIKKLNERVLSRSNVNFEISELTNSELYRETISVARDRLKSLGWEMKDVKREEDYLVISVYKINI